jgi:hypothetical protein
LYKIIIPAAIFLITFAVYNLTSPVPQGGDTVPGRYLPFSILCDGDFNLNEFTFLYKNEEKPPYYLIRNDSGELLSTFGPGIALSVLPFYSVILLFKNNFDFDSLLLIAKILSSFFVSLSAVFLFLSALRLSNRHVALFATAAYALGSSVFAISSQGLWQHTPASLFVALGLFLLVHSGEKKWLAGLASFSFSLAFLVRHQLFIIWFIFLLYVFFRHRKSFIHYLCLAYPSIIFMIAYNFYYFDSMIAFPQIEVSGHLAEFKTGSSDVWSTPVLTGLSGLLISPSRGLLLFSPVFIFSFIGMFMVFFRLRIQKLKTDENNILYVSIALISIAYILLMSKWYDWWGGWGFAYRPIVDVMPLLSLLLIPFFNFIYPRRNAVSIIVRIIVISFLIFSIYVQFLGTYSSGFIKWHSISDVDRDHERLWSVKDSMLIYYLSHPDFGNREKVPDFIISGSTSFTACSVRIFKNEM